jgi:hypothetical protein
MNEVWSYDFVFDQTEDGRRLKWLPICDEFTRENVALEVELRMEASDVVRVLAAAVAERGAPEHTPTSSTANPPSNGSCKARVSAKTPASPTTPTSGPPKR